LEYWYEKFDSVINGSCDTWDYSWQFTCWINNALSIVPNHNLVTNIGFSNDATHTTNVQSIYTRMETRAVNFPLEHSQFVIANKVADDFVQRTVYDNRKLISIWKKKAKKAININC